LILSFCLWHFKNALSVQHSTSISLSFEPGLRFFDLEIGVMKSAPQRFSMTIWAD